MYGFMATLATDPLVWVFGFLLVAVMRLWHKPVCFRSMVSCAFALLAFSGWYGFPEYLLSRWEPPIQTRAMQENLRLDGVVGVVVLGGIGGGAQSNRGHRHMQLNSAAERFTESLALAVRYPHLKVLFTGGCGPNVELSRCQPEAHAAGRLYVSLGLGAERLILEDASRTTYENAVFSAQLRGVDHQKRWLLVTSAAHMRRAIATFRAAGWNVEPWPVDFEGVDYPRWWGFSMEEGLRKWRILLHEWIGYAYYRLRNRSA